MANSFDDEAANRPQDRAEGAALDAILKRGRYLRLRDFPGGAEVLSKVRQCILDGVESLEGAVARRGLEARGLTLLHEFLPAERIGALRDHLMPRIRPDILSVTCGVARQILDIRHEFFVDDYTILRVNYPYEVALKSSMQAENPGIGRVSEAAKRLAGGSQKGDPVYDPNGYHKNQPPASWAHGPHLDTWTGHSRDGINLWWAVEDVLEENSMIFYPETFGRKFAVDPRSLYLSAGFPLPRPEKLAMAAGELLVFNPEMLHGTHLNTTSRTRLAISTRINPHRPRFDPGCFYAREFWHSSRNLEQGRYEDVIRFRREENFEDAPAGPPAPALPTAYPTVVLEEAPSRDRWTAIAAAERLSERGKLLVCAGDRRIAVLRTARGLHAVGADCPHLGVSMLDGFHDESQIYCPAHGVAFDLASGRSSCSLLSLAIYEAKQADGQILLRLAAPA